MKRGRPNKGQPPYHKAFGKQTMHQGWWRDCPTCKAEYGRAWRQQLRQEEMRMRNTYEIEVFARCPLDPAVKDVYTFTIRSQTMITAETINEFFASHADKKNVFQETLTADCAKALGASVTSVGWHSGVKVTCEAP